MSSANHQPANVLLDAESLPNDKAKEIQWLEENREAILSYNRWVRENALPLEDAIMF